ncbi:hypothetical protein [Paraglaciecola hydrolytica]|uniref:Uncharacterized protein n=1 Tax=Paraglaciecola hydrolytica TaxID=1799789 RepID=A0A136A307_9ALTE|nr:hypothetical protein [Paraglaciecola hydrolytica]KXI29594.1 hypothetical protein AX660_05940 [Paraglaciecola hydrolytica]
MSSKYKELLEELKSTAADFSELNVRTFTGDLKTAIGPDDNGTPTLGVDLKNLDELLKKAVTGGTIKLEAMTVLKIDGDIDQFLDTNISDDMKSIHDLAVATGKESRAAIVAFVKDFAS